MIELLLRLPKGLWLIPLKLLALGFVGGMVLVQIPELRYDFGPTSPVTVSGPEDLSSTLFSRATFVSVSGTANFERGFVYQRYGLNYTYFTIEPYGMRLVARTYHKVTDEWKDLNRFLGKLRPFNKQPFSYRIRQIYRDNYKIDVSEDTFFLALDDVPKPSGWQVGAMLFAGLLWLIMFYMFFFYRGWRDKEKSTRSGK
jgi:hypothetical protein